MDARSERPGGRARISGNVAGLAELQAALLGDEQLPGREFGALW